MQVSPSKGFSQAAFYDQPQNNYDYVPFGDTSFLEHHRISFRSWNTVCFSSSPTQNSVQGMMQISLLHRNTCANKSRLTNKAVLHFKSHREWKPYSKHWRMFIQAEVQLKWNYSCWNRHLTNHTLQHKHPFSEEHQQQLQTVETLRAKR